MSRWRPRWHAGLTRCQTRLPSWPGCVNTCAPSDCDQSCFPATASRPRFDSGPTRPQPNAWRCGVRSRSRPRQAGPATRLVGYDVLRTDGYVHRVGHIAAWPRIDVGTEWMYPLLESAMAGSVRTVSMHLEAVSTEQALAEVRDARTTGAVAQRKRDEKGIITTEEEERRVDEARSRERELTRGYRQHKIAGLVMVSSPDPETTERAWRLAQRKAVECHLDLREFHARGHEAWAATVPLCRLRFSRGLL